MSVWVQVTSIPNWWALTSGAAVPAAGKGRPGSWAAALLAGACRAARGRWHVLRAPGWASPPKACAPGLARTRSSPSRPPGPARSSPSPGPARSATQRYSARTRTPVGRGRSRCHWARPVTVTAPLAVTAVDHNSFRVRVTSHRCLNRDVIID